MYSSLFVSLLLTQITDSKRKGLKMAKNPFAAWAIAFGTSKLTHLRIKI